MGQIPRSAERISSFYKVLLHAYTHEQNYKFVDNPVHIVQDHITM